MNQQSGQSMSGLQTDYLGSLLGTARRRPGLWLVPLALAVLVAIVMAFAGPGKWDATQSFVVREELIGRIVGPGRFDSLDSMKTAQELIQEVARRPGVLERVLRAAGQEQPSREDVESLRKAISFEAPGGAEVGKTEILTMRIESSSAERATRLVDILFEETRREIRALRQREANSMLLEVGQSVDLAQERLTETTTAMREIESQVGDDLSELRGLTETWSGSSNLRQQITEIKAEIRQARQAEQEATLLIRHLQQAVNDPLELLATPRELLESQPALSELKRQLIDAQVNRSNVGGVYSASHPRYEATANSVEDIKRQVHEELAVALKGLESQQQLARQQAETLREQSQEISQRITVLASMRVDYARLVNELNLRNDELAVAHKEYAQAEAILRAAEKVDFMSRLDEAQPGLRPLGPSTKTLLLGAAVAGLLIGLGLLMMVTPSPTWLPPGPLPAAQPLMSPATAPPPAAEEQPSPDADDQPVELGGITIAQAEGGIPGFVIPDIGHGPFPNQPTG
jgi:uncharacterized protein involved in exopolysaccharide biosynthesis